MPKVILSIFKMGEEYRALIKIGENAEPTANGRIVYQDGKEVKEGHRELKGLIRKSIRKMKEKAEKWAREQGIRSVHNLYFNPYE